MGLAEENEELKRRLATAEALVSIAAKLDASIRDSEVRHRLLIESWTQAVWETDAAGAVVTDSPSWRAYTGQTLEEWLGYGWLDAIHPDDRTYAERQWREAMAARRAVDAEFRLLAPDGGWRWTNVRAAPVLNSNGTIDKWAGVNIDIDARKRAETALRGSEERFRALFASSPAPFVVVTPDSPRFTIADVNDAYLSAMLRTRDQVVGRGLFDAFPINPGDPGAAGEKELRASVERVLATRQSDELPVFRYDIERRDGSYEERWWRPVTSPLLDADGAVVAIVHNPNDVTVEHRAVAALRESEERLNLALEATALAIYAWDLVSDELITNERFRELVGIPPGEPVIGANVMAYCVHPGDRARVDPDLARAMDSSGNGKFVFDHRLSRIGPLGHPWVFSHGQVYFGGPDDARQPVRVFGTLQDITARKQAEIAARENEERQAFLLKLSDALRPLDDPDTVADAACRLLAEELQASRAQYTVMVDDTPGAEVAEVRGESLRSGEKLVRRFAMNAFGRALVDHLRSDRTGVVNNIAEETRITQEQRDIHLSVGSASHISAPRVRGGRLVVTLTLHDLKPREWTALEISLVEEVAGRTWDAVERAKAELARRESEARFQQFANASAAGLWIRDANILAMEYVSPAISATYGVEADALLGDVARWAATIVPEDRDGALRHLDKARQGEVAVHEFRIQRPSDGAFRWIKNTDFPLRDGGHIPRIGGIAEDVTESKLATEHSAVLLAELQHRVRNIMALLRSITNRTAERAKSVPEYRDLMMGRLLAFARVQALLTRAANVSVGIAIIVHDEVSVQAQHVGQYRLDGPDVILSSKAAEVLTLAIHELATNAAKYGALSVPTGRVSVRWSTIEKRGGPWLAFDWIEEGAPASPLSTSDTPRRRGFGSELIEERIPYELRGRGQVTIDPAGARCHLEFPLQHAASILETGAPVRATVFGGTIDMRGEPNLTGRRVLVVEDDFYLATDAARALRGAGADVVGPCATEEDARAELAEQRPDAVVVDINLGPGPSFKLAEALKDRGIPFVFTTGYDAEVIPAEFEGVERLEKPLQLRQIVGAVARLTSEAA